MAGRPGWGPRRWMGGAALVSLVLLVSGHEAPAYDAPGAAHDLQTSDDFRLRVSAALTLGRMHAPGARGLLENALGDPNPAVRIAAAAGLGALGDPAAIPALQRRASAEPSAGVRSQLTATLALLEAAANRESAEQKWRGTRYVVAIGDMHNRSGVRGDHASDVLRSATRAHAQTIPGALVSESSDPALFEQATARHVPILLLDGALQRLSMGQKNAQLSYSAQVDYSMRRVPQQQLRGMLSGSATSFGSMSALHDPGSVMLLEDQAIDGAVESALRGADRGFGEAIR